jgi:hypothetical protein
MHTSYGSDVFGAGIFQKPNNTYTYTFTHKVYMTRTENGSRTIDNKLKNIGDNEMITGILNKSVFYYFSWPDKY